MAGLPFSPILVVLSQGNWKRFIKMNVEVCRAFIGDVNGAHSRWYPANSPIDATHSFKAPEQSPDISQK